MMRRIPRHTCGFEAFGVEFNQAYSLAVWHERINGPDFHLLSVLRVYVKAGATNDQLRALC